VTGKPNDGPDDNHEGQQGNEQDNQSEEDAPSNHIHLAVGTPIYFGVTVRSAVRTVLSSFELILFNRDSRE
jgi:hypothetical protein